MNIGILGANGLVGREILAILKERKVKIDNLRLFGLSSVGQKIEFDHQEYLIERPHDFTGLDVILGATNKVVAKQYKDEIIASGCIFIDNSSAFRLEEDVPLIIPQINGQKINNHKLIASPNCTTVIACLAVEAFKRLGEIEGLIVSTYQAASGAGFYGLKELEEQIENDKIEAKVFEYPIAYNCLCKIGSLEKDGYTDEELKLENESRKILEISDLKVSCTCVRVPIKRSHSLSITVLLKNEIEQSKLLEYMKQQIGVIVDENDYPTPLKTSNQDKVEIGRIRKDRVIKNAYCLFCCGDQLRRGAATNVVEILESLKI